MAGIVEVKLRGLLRATGIGAAAAFVVVPVGYAITAVHADVWLGAGCGMAISVNVGRRGSTLTGFLVGSLVGTAAVLIVDSVPGNRWAFILPPLPPLTVGLLAGFNRLSFSGYRAIRREAFPVSVLFGVGILPAQIASSGSAGLLVAAAPVALYPWTVLVCGILSRRAEAWRDTRFPRWLTLGLVAVPVLVAFASGEGLLELAVFLPLLLLALMTPAFVLGRAAATWLRPRLRVYQGLVDYLRVMWVPIGGFALGFLAIIVLFAGLYGMLERFRPGAFDSTGAGITEWVSFAFFAGLAQDFATVVPVSVEARVLVGIQLVLSVAWALVLFAAVMSSIQPRLERIARRQDEPSDSP